MFMLYTPSSIISVYMIWDEGYSWFPGGTIWHTENSNAIYIPR
jgi:hypothetical protein